MNVRNLLPSGKNRQVYSGLQWWRHGAAGTMGCWGQACQRIRDAQKAQADLPTATREQGEKVKLLLGVSPELWKHPTQGLILSISFAEGKRGPSPHCLVDSRQALDHAKPNTDNNSTLQLLTENVLWARHCARQICFSFCCYCSQIVQMPEFDWYVHFNIKSWKDICQKCYYWLLSGR